MYSMSMFYPRLVLKNLENELTTREAVVITGMRQVGKSTVLKHLFSLTPSKNKVMIDLESPLERKFFETDDFDAILNSLASRGITKNERAFLFIDEIQNLPIISRVAKYLIDHYETKFFLTGSSSFYIKNLFPESMAGRKLITELFPLTFPEFLLFKEVNNNNPAPFALKSKIKAKNKFNNIMLEPLYREYMTFGGFPAVVLENDQERKKILLKGIFQSYFEKDVKTLADLKDRSRLRDLILLLVSRIGSRIEIEKIASELEVTRMTIYSYLEFLEATYFIKLLPRFSRSIDRSRAGRRKVYFSDTGLAKVLGSVSDGQAFENSVFQTLRPNHDLTFYTKENKEIDFVADAKIALEAKITSSKRDIFDLSKRAEAIRISDYYTVSLNWDSGEKIIMATDL